MPGAIERNPRKFLRLAELLARFERDDIERAVALLLESPDLMDGEADANDGMQAELTTDYCAAGLDHRDDAPMSAGIQEEPAWIEFHTRGRHKGGRPRRATGGALGIWQHPAR